MLQKIAARRRLILLLVAEILILAWIATGWNGSEVNEDWGGEELLTTAGVYNPDFNGGGFYIDSTFGSVEGYAVTPGLDLKKGTYQVTIEYEAQEEGQTYSATADWAGYWVVTGKQNEPLEAGKNVVSFPVWLNRDTEGYRISLNYNGAGYLLIRSIHIFQTNDWWHMHLFAGFFLLAAVNLLYFGFRKRKWADFSARQINVAAGIGITALLASVPLMTSYLYSAHDLQFHLLRIEGIRDALSAGQFPVRIQPGWFEGYGYASSVFYGELFLYIPAVIRLFGFPLQTAYKIYVALVNLATCAGAYYCLKKICRREYPALLGSILYTLAPYRLGNIYVRAAVGEYTAMMFYPFLVAGLYLVLKKETEKTETREGRNLLVAGFTGIIQSHVISCEMTGLFTLLICLVFVKRILLTGRWKALVAGAALTVGLNLWFLIPFADYSLSGSFQVVEPGGTAGIQTYNAFASQLFDFFPNGYGSSYSIFERLQSPTQIPLTVGFVLMGTGFAFLLYCVNVREKKMQERKLGLLCVGAACLALWMATTWFPWDGLAGLGKIPSLLIGNLQYGWRFLSIASVLLAVAACCLLSMVEAGQEKGIRYGAFAVYGILGVLCAGWFLSSVMNNSSVLLSRDRSEVDEQLVTALEYVPKGTDRNGFADTSPLADEGVRWEAYGNDRGKVDVNCFNETGAEGSIQLPVIYYEGYRAQSVETGEELPIESGENNRIRVILPAGFCGKVHVQFQEPWLWRMGDLLSLAVLLFCLFETGHAGLLLTKRGEMRNERKKNV